MAADDADAVGVAGVPVGHYVDAHAEFGWCEDCDGRSAEDESAMWRVRHAIESGAGWVGIDRRGPEVAALLRWFEFDHLPPALHPVARRCWRVARAMAATLNDGPELTAGLRALLTAKDAFVRAKLDTDAVGPPCP